jgi:hypothetical protein
MYGKKSSGKGNGSDSPGRNLSTVGSMKVEKPKQERGGVSATTKRISNRKPQYVKGG